MTGKISAEPYHIPVMVKEAINFLAPSRGGIYVDCTLGGGGHSREILKVLNGKGTLIGIDQDSEAIKKANAELGNFKNFKAIKDKFENIGSILDACGIPSIDGCLFDLGVSSRQFDNPTRGFSFRFEAKLDMRMDLSDATTAFDLINKLSAKELSDIFKEYGEEQHAKAIAADIETMRKLRPIQTTSQLAELIERRVRFRSAGKRSIHPATKAFMALRIAVNRELQQIETALNVLVKRMNANGIIVAISYHSLEDRIIKNIFREISLKPKEDKYSKSALKKERHAELLTKKPICPSPEEQKLNSRSRSAKMRAVKIIG